MYLRSLSTVGHVCLRCEWRLLQQRLNYRRNQYRYKSTSKNVSQSPRRALHASSIPSQFAYSPTVSSQTFEPSLVSRPPHLPIRQHLEQWQQQNGAPTDEVLSAFERHPARSDIQNGLSKLSSAFKADEEALLTEWDGAEDDEGEELITIGLFLKPGDVVELSQPGREPVLAVFVQQLDDSSQFFSVNGRWCHSILARVAFAITDCIDPALLQPLLPFLPTNPDKANPKGEVHVPADVAAPVRLSLERMTVEAEKIYRTNAPVLDTAYTVLADPIRTRMMTLTQITKTLLARNDPSWVPSVAALLAVRKALNHNEFRFRSDIRSHRLTNVFAIRPKNDVKTVESVHEWIREYREHLALSVNSALGIPSERSKGAVYVAEFIEKARRLIAKSRKHRDPNPGVLGPSKGRLTDSDKAHMTQIVWGEPFTSTDKQIINFLQAWVMTGQFRGMSGLHAACANLILATDCYGEGLIQHGGARSDAVNEINRATGMVFLQEIGVITPYENYAIYDEQLMLPTVRLSRNIELLNTKAELTRRNPDFRDAMADLRRDWGSTTVYCIDDADAQEIDDGISIERLPGQDSEFWIHVHVANPTAFFDKTHTLSGLAAHMTESVYTPERSFPMLPKWATQGYFSLDSNRPVITFSSRINMMGNVLETKIQHGIIRKIVSVTPSQVATLLGHVSRVTRHTLVVGGQTRVTKNNHSSPDITIDQLRDLQDLYTAAQALWARRKAAGGIRFGGVRSHVRVFEDPHRSGLTWNAPSVDRARLVLGDPIIEVTSTVSHSLANLTIGPRNIVEEMMLLACQTAASWCTERKIPLMYRGTITLPPGDGLCIDQIKQQILSYWEKHEEPPLGLALRYTKSLGRAIAHSEPLPHKIIGVPSYVKVTSPLRRFSDMISHWQIEAAIRYEARSGKKFNAADFTSSPRGVLPFSQHQMQESIVTLSPRERIIKMTGRASERFWTALAFLRAFNYKEAPLPSTFKYFVSTAPSNAPGRGTKIRGELSEWGLKATMLYKEGYEDVQMGDEWEVSLESVEVFNGHIYVNPLRLLSRETEADTLYTAS